MSSVAYYAFLFQHTIKLEEYFEVENLTFHNVGSTKVCTTNPLLFLGIGEKYENTWTRDKSATVIKNDFGISSHNGNILTWEAIKNNCSIANAIPHVLKNSKGLKSYKSTYLLRLELFARNISLTLSMAHPMQVSGYLGTRGIKRQSLNSQFFIGSPQTFEKIQYIFNSYPLKKEQITGILWDLFISKKSGDKRFLQYKPSIIVPVYSDKNIFLGFHGRNIGTLSPKNKYFNTGYLKEEVKKVLYGENNVSVQTAIKSKNQIILTKGIFDFFVCYQNGYCQVLATLSQGISAQQFNKVIQLPIQEIIVGFSSPREREIILGLVTHSLKSINISIINTADDIDDIVLAGKLTLANIVQDALQGAQTTEEGQRIAHLRTRDDRMNVLLEEGHTFIITGKELENIISTSKGKTPIIKLFLENKAKANNSHSKEKDFIRFPKTFTTPQSPSTFGAEIRVLLYLLLKTKGKSRPINFTHKQLCYDLSISKPVLSNHLTTLRNAGYLLEKKSIKITKLKKKTVRKVLFYYYPSTIRYV